MQVDADEFVRSVTQIISFPFLPELRVRVAPQMIPVWEATQHREGQEHLPAPFWAFAWPGGQAFARYILDHPDVVRGKRVLDFAAGNGLAAIAAARAGAAVAVASDVDRLARHAQAANAELNDVHIEARTQDVVGHSVHEEFDLVLAGDVCYEWVLATRIVPWLRQLAADGVVVLLADPGRKYLPETGLERLAVYDVPTLLDLEAKASMRTTLWRILPE
jgi:predicted nicotinamide N-methyase